MTDLSKKHHQQAKCPELQAYREAVEQPVQKRPKIIGRVSVCEVKRKQCCSKACPQQAKKQKHGLVAESLMFILENHPKLNVNNKEQKAIQGGVNDRQTEMHTWRDCGFESWWRNTVVRQCSSHISTSMSSSYFKEQIS